MLKRIILAALAGALIAAGPAVFAAEDGDKAPAFTLESTHGPVSLSDFREKKNVVLAFYYKDFTGG